MINLSRIDALFDPSYVNDVGIIGCGAIGSKVIDGLIRLGVQNIHCYDMDVVEDVNLSNQCFTPEHIGYNKATACAMHAASMGVGSTVFAHEGKIEDGDLPIHQVIILLVDSMDYRRKFMRQAIYDSRIEFILEARMSTDQCQVYLIESRSQYEKWLKNSSYEGDPELFGECKKVQSIGHSSGFASDTIIWLFMNRIMCHKVPNSVDIFYTGTEFHGESYSWE